MTARPKWPLWSSSAAFMLRWSLVLLVLDQATKLWILYGLQLQEGDQIAVTPFFDLAAELATQSTASSMVRWRILFRCTHLIFIGISSTLLTLQSLQVLSCSCMRWYGRGSLLTNRTCLNCAILVAQKQRRVEV